MKTIGLIGGLTWHSTLDYYRLMNELVQERLGGVHSAKIILHSVDFAEIKEPTQREDWDAIAAIICQAAVGLQQAGADCIVIGANTMHNIAHKVTTAVTIPLIHIADATAQAITAKGLKKVTLLGTRYTMLMDFYSARLAAHGISVVVPSMPDIEFINHTIYEEFGKGIFLPDRKERYLTIINSLVQEGAEGVVLGCTEIPILIKQEDCPVPVFDTANLHTRAAVEFALS